MTVENIARFIRGIGSIVTKIVAGGAIHKAIAEGEDFLGHVPEIETNVRNYLNLPPLEKRFTQLVDSNRVLGYVHDLLKQVDRFYDLGCDVQAPDG